MPEYETITKYDRTYGDMRDLCKNSAICMRLKPATVQHVETLGRAETFIVEVIRHEQLGDYIFVQAIDDKQAVTRLALPPAVAKAVLAQIRQLDKRSEQRAKERRSAVAKRLADERMARGEKPAFLLHKKGKETA